MKIYSFIVTLLLLITIVIIYNGGNGDLVINDKEIKPTFKFEEIGVKIIPSDGYDVKMDSDFVAEITLSGYNSIKNYPIVIIADSIYNNQLISNIDTFYTDEYSTVIRKRFMTTGKKIFYGKYVSYTLEGDLFSLVFPIEIIVE